MPGLRTATVAFLVLATACPADDDDGNPDSPFEANLEATIRARCELEVECHGSPDLATCLASSQPASADLAAILASGRASFDADKAAACLADLKKVLKCSAGITLGF